MKSLLLCATVIMTLGIVDQIHDDYATIEYADATGELQHMDVPVSVIPCKVSEGTQVRFSKTSARTKIICSN